MLVIHLNHKAKAIADWRALAIICFAALPLLPGNSFGDTTCSWSIVQSPNTNMSFNILRGVAVGFAE